MDYSDENLYQLLLALPQQLRHSHHAGAPFGRHGCREAFPDSQEGPASGESAEQPFPDMHMGFAGAFDSPAGPCPPAAPFGRHGGRNPFRGPREETAPGEPEGQPFPDMHKGFAHGTFGPRSGPHLRGDRRPPLARERILRLIGETEPVSQTTLAEHLAIRPQSLSEQLAKLENDGLILRTTSEQDKRVTLVSLTEQGRQRAQEVEAARAEQSSAFLSPLSQEEREQLFLLLQKLLSRA